MMKVTTYKGYSIFYDKEENNWEAEDFKGNGITDLLPSMKAVEKEIDRIDRKNRPENYGETKPAKIPAFVMEYGEKVQSVVVTSEDSYGDELWVSTGKKHWKQDKDEVFYDTPENRVIVEKMAAFDKEIASLEKLKEKMEKTLKRFK
jgi:hypothetical protein